MNTSDLKPLESAIGDTVMKEIRRIKDQLSNARGNDVDRLFAEARERQKVSGHRVVNLGAKKLG